jgi:signal transduction histidine kinase
MDKNRRILVVDDDSGILDAFGSIFGETSGNPVMDEGRALFDDLPGDGSSVVTDPWEIVTAGNGEEGVLTVQAAVTGKISFAMIFLDMKMPGIDGAETARRIWQIDPHVKIVIMTAYSEFKPEKISTIAGREELFYLRKPFARDEILQFARSLVRQWNLERERDRLQEKLREANLHLEEKVAERTRQLQRAHSRLEALDRDKMTFLRYLSHEMNTPLNWIGAACTIDKKALSESDQQMLDFVDMGFERLNTIVQGVLDYFEMVGQALPLHPKPISISAEISDILKEKIQKIQGADIRMNIRLDPDQTVEADPEYFRELLETLLNNALDYSQPGGTVTVTGNRAGEPFRLEILDQGKGIRTKNIRRIFEAFATEACHRREAGCGLSLPRARFIAEAHGWRIWAESEGAGKGARLVVEMGEG